MDLEFRNVEHAGDKMYEAVCALGLEGHRVKTTWLVLSVRADEEEVD